MLTREVQEQIDAIAKVVRAHLGTTYGSNTSQIPHPTTSLTQYVRKDTLTTAGDIPYATAASTWTRLAITNSRVLYSVAGAPTWASVTSVLDDIATTAGDMLYNNAGTLDRLAIGASGRLMTSTGAAPQWVTLTSVLDDIMTTSGDTMHNVSGTITRLAKGPVSGVYHMDSAGNFPRWPTAESGGLAAFNFNTTTYEGGILADNYAGYVTWLIDNGSTAAASGGTLQVVSDTANSYFQSHASGVVITRCGQALGGWTEFYANSSGFLIHSVSTTSLKFGTNDILALTISGTQVATFVNAPIISALTASKALLTDASKVLTSSTYAEADWTILGGRASPQQLNLGTASGATTGYISSTVHATKGKWHLNSAATITVDEANVRFGIGAATPLDKLYIEYDNNASSLLGIQIRNTNSGASAFSGFQILDNAAATSVFAGFNNTTHEFRINNIATTPVITFMISSTARIKADGTGIGVFNVTPVARAGAYTQTYSTADKTHATPTAATLTDNSAGTPTTTLEALTSGTVYATDVAAIRNNFADLAAMVNKNTADHLDLAQLVNSIIDDFQAYGWLQ